MDKREIEIERNREIERWTKERSGARDHSFMFPHKSQISCSKQRQTKINFFQIFLKKEKKMIDGGKG